MARRSVVTRGNLAWHVRAEDGRAEDGRETFDQYRRNMTALYEVEGVSADARRRFFNTSAMTLTSLGVVGRGRSSGQIMRRNPREPVRADIDGINLLVNLAPMVGDCAGRDLRSAPGDVQLRDLSRPAASQLDRVDVYSLLIPRQHVPVALLRPEGHGLVLGRDTIAGQLIGGHIRTLVDLAGDLDEARMQAGVRAALLMTSRALGDERPLPPEARAALRMALRWRAERFIAANLLDPDLDADAVAKACGGSRATLYRTFEEDGGVHRFIQQRRLEQAHQRLWRRDGSVGDIAYQHGFSSQPHFSRVFRQRFGYSPSDVRPKAAVPAEPLSPSGPMSHHIAVGWLKTLVARPTEA